METENNARKELVIRTTFFVFTVRLQMIRTKLKKCKLKSFCVLPKDCNDGR